MRKCAERQTDISMRPNAARYCEACAYARLLRRQRTATVKYRQTRPRFAYCSEDQSFADWLDRLLFQRPVLSPDLNHEQETRQPFNFPEYLRYVRKLPYPESL